MTFLALDGKHAGVGSELLPDGYHCVMCLDGFPDIVSCHPDYHREQFILALLEGLEAYLHDNNAAVSALNRIRHGSMTALGLEVLSCIISANRTIYAMQMEGRRHARS